MGNLETSKLESAILAAYKKQQKEQDPEKAAAGIAKDFATAVEAFVKSGKVKFATGNVTGTAPSGGGPITAGKASDGTIE